MAEAPTQDAERTRLVTELAPFRRGESLDEVGAESLVLALPGVTGLPEEPLLRRKRMWCFEMTLTQDTLHHTLVSRFPSGSLI